MSDSTEVAVRPVSVAREAFDVVARRADAMARSTIIPEAYHGHPANVLVALDMADRTGFPALTVMQNLHIIQGKPSWSSQFLIAAVNSSGRFSPMRYRFQGTEGEDDWGCRAVAKDLQDGEELVGALITIAMAKAEGWATKKGSKWLTMPDQMLRYRAAAFWARVYSPELTAGLHTSDEVDDIGPSPKARVHELAATLDATDDEPEVVNAEIIEDAGAPPTDSEVNTLRGLMDRLALDLDQAEPLEALVKANDGPGVREAIKNLQLEALRGTDGEKAEQGGLQA